MQTESETQAFQDLKVVCEALRAKRPVSAEVIERVTKRFDEIVKWLDSQPPTDLAVPLLRELRDR
jgi:hypothetical protein